MLEPRALVKSVLCVAHKSGECGVRLTVLDFCSLVSILETVLHWAVRAGTSARYQVVYRNSETRLTLEYHVP